MSNYYLSTNGQVTGPFTIKQIQGKFDRAEITADAQVCVEGTQNWFALEPFLRTKKSDRNTKLILILIAVAAIGLGIYAFIDWQGKVHERSRRAAEGLPPIESSID